MPVFSYIVYPAPGARDDLLHHLAAMEECHAVAAQEKDIIVLVGGAPLNDAFAEDIEADAYCRDAAVAVDTAKKLIAIRRNA